MVKNGTFDEAKGYIQTCSNPYRGTDKYGRSLLHVAAANGNEHLIPCPSFVKVFICLDLSSIDR